MTKPPVSAGMAPLALLAGLALLAALTVYPALATHADGRADHTGALLLFWAMSAGFVRGLGFIPEHWLPRFLFSGLACLLALLLALLRLAPLPLRPLIAFL